MQRKLCLIILCVFFLAACGGNNPTPALPTAAVLPTNESQTQATPPPADVPTATPALLVTQPQRQFGGDATLPPAGTLVAAVTEDPMAGQVFDSIIFVREGGLAGGTMTIEIKGDGTLINNGQTKTITPEQVTELTSLIDKAGYFGMQGIFASPGTSADIYKYTLTVERAGSSKTIDAQDGMTPPELMDIFALVTLLAE